MGIIREANNAGKIELYSAAICPFAQKVAILLDQKNIPYKRLEIDLARKPDFLIKLSPYNELPIIKHKNRYLYESDVINQYLNTVFPTPNFLSNDPYITANMQIWITYCNSKFIPVFYKLLLIQECSVQVQLRRELLNVLFYIEKEGFGKWSNGRKYFFGDQLSLVDICFYPFFERFVINEHYRDIRIPEVCYQLRRWIENMQTLPSVKHSLNSKEFYIKRYSEYAEGTFSSKNTQKILDDLWR